MKRLIIIASGSKNNAALIENNGKTILIDCGVSLRSLCTVLDRFGLDKLSLKAVFVTHSHSDHTKNLATLKRNLDIPFYSGVCVDMCENFCSPVCIDGFKVEAFKLSHDVPCCGYKISFGDTSVCIATDTGIVSDEILENLVGADTVVLESNHDEQMLKYGPYPPNLKARILSECGHLCNKDCAKTLAYLASKGMKKAVLAHISEHNNTPLLAKSTAMDELLKYGFDSVEVYTAEPDMEIEL